MAAADTIKEINIEVKRCAECSARFGIDAAFCPFDGSQLETSTWDRKDSRSRIRVGDRYEVLEPIGEGGMGTVYEVRHVTLNRHFAMKVLRRDLASDAGLAARFLQEARATAAIKHPSVVAINDFGEMEDGVPYFVMELLEGETVATRIRARGPMSPATVIRIGKQITEGLSASHRANVIHRDLKPDNVFLVGKKTLGKLAEDEIRIVDFGAAKIIGGSKLTRPGIVFGTPYYMSPEQASGQEIDGRADVYSLGVLLYEMITGRVPFEADTYMGVLTKHMFQAPARLAAPSGVQLGELESVVMRALQKDPTHRFASMEELGEALVLAGVGGTPSSPAQSARSTAKMGGSSSSSSTSTAPASGPGRTVRLMSTADRIEQSVSRRVADEARRKRRTIVTALITALATCAVGGAVVAAGLGAEDVPPSPTPSATPTARVVVPTTPTTPTTTATIDTIDTAQVQGSTPSSTSTAGAAAIIRKPQPQPPPVIAASPRPRNTASSTPTQPPQPPQPTPPRNTDDFPDPWKR